jgi:hypothetical protein
MGLVLLAAQAGSRPATDGQHVRACSVSWGPVAESRGGLPQQVDIASRYAAPCCFKSDADCARARPIHSRTEWLHYLDRYVCQVYAGEESDAYCPEEQQALMGSLAFWPVRCPMAIEVRRHCFPPTVRVSRTAMAWSLPLSSALEFLCSGTGSSGPWGLASHTPASAPSSFSRHLRTKI